MNLPDLNRIHQGDVCIRAGTSEKGACEVCGAPVARHVFDNRTIGWRPTCRHKKAVLRPCVVFDPFMGAGTTALVSAQLNRSFIGTELSGENVALATNRIKSELEQRKLGIAV